MGDLHRSSLKTVMSESSSVARARQTEDLEPYFERPPELSKP
jgi:hypothetical protein